MFARIHGDKTVDFSHAPSFQYSLIFRGYHLTFTVRYRENKKLSTFDRPRYSFQLKLESIDNHAPSAEEAQKVWMLFQLDPVDWAGLLAMIESALCPADEFARRPEYVNLVLSEIDNPIN